MRHSLSEVVRKPGWFTEFQILVELAEQHSRMRQRDLADALGVTVQAVSKHIRRLRAEELIELRGVEYILTSYGIERLGEYTTYLETQVKKAFNCSRLQRPWPAIASKQVSAGEEVGLVMRNGVAYAVGRNHRNAKAFGVALMDVSVGEDVALRNMRGTIDIERGTVAVVKLPSINQGGSRNADLAKVREIYARFHPDRIAVMGTVARAVMNKLNLKADLEFGVTRSAAMAALRGLNVFILSTGRMTNRVLEEIEKVNIRHSSEIQCTVEDCQLSHAPPQDLELE
jgi:putative transcriptional regulator